MKIFIWEEVVTGLTDNYHDGGGLVVIAKTLKDAREFAKKSIFKEKPAKDGFIDGVINKLPDRQYKVEAKEKEVFIFPDAGCC